MNKNNVVGIDRQLLIIGQKTGSITYSFDLSREQGEIIIAEYKFSLQLQSVNVSISLQGDFGICPAENPRLRARYYWQGSGSIECPVVILLLCCIADQHTALWHLRFRQGEGASCSNTVCSDLCETLLIDSIKR